MMRDVDDNSDDWAVPVLVPAKHIVMGRPVVPNALELAASKAVGVDLSDPYDNSRKGTCNTCEREIWIGPLQQHEIDQDPENFVTLCPLHAVLEGGPNAAVSSLGNIHPRGN